MTVARRGRTTRFDGSPSCNWPGGTPLALYAAAAQRDAHALDVLEPRLRCDDDPTLLTRPTPWASVTACVHGLWTPRAERLIRLAERIPALESLGLSRLLPRDPGARRCAIGAGGPKRRIFRGLCGVSLRHVWSTPLVTVVETWSVPGVSRTFSHRWEIEIRAGRARLLGHAGAPPPQLWA